MNKDTRHTRIAPSPTGYMHLGTARTAYFNWLASRSTDGTFVLRIDDTDADRSDNKYMDSILDSLAWLGLDFDSTFRQSDRQDVYRAYLDKLIADKKVVKRDGAWFVAPDMLGLIPDTWDDKLIRKPVKVSDHDKGIIADLVLWKSDDTPTYHFASCVDDIDTGINTIIRGDDHKMNTAKHILIYRLIGADLPDFFHVGLLTDMNGKKYSKRNGAMSVVDLKDMGFGPDAVLNFMLRMGWGPRVDDKSAKTIDKARALDLFWDGGKMRPAPSKVNMDTLDWFNRKYGYGPVKA
ncbi:MAG: glutamate--tRNA ligase family protein [bacterium]|nr:glutamate--tRNA ligase family protein [bacterium]